LDDTIKSVKSVLNQTHENFHIYLADNKSDNNQGEILEQTFGENDKITVVQFDSNLGFAKAHNYIFENFVLNNENYKYVALLNNDAFADVNWIKNLVARIKNENVGMVSSKMINYFNKTVMDNAGHMLLNTAEVLPHGFGESIDNYNEANLNFGACAGATIYKVKMLKEIGIYDKYFNTGYEDAELGIRANLFGYETWYEPKAIVYHKISQSLNKVKNFEYLVYIQKSIFYSYFKLMPLSILLINTPIIIAKYLMVIVFNLFTRRFKFIKLIIIASFKFIKEFGKVIDARKVIYNKNVNPDIWYLMKKMKFFLFVDLKRAIKFLRPGNKTYFETYC